MISGIGKTAKIIVGLGVFLFLLFIVVIFIPNGASGTVEFSVGEGESLKEISSNLASNGVIESRFMFWLYTVLSGDAKNLKAGDYKFSLPISVYRVAFSLSNGRNTSDVELTIPEGFTAGQIEERIEQVFGEVKKVSSFSALDWVGEFLFFGELSRPNPNMEGFLFPDTYRLKEGASAENITRKLLANFELKTKELRSEIKKEGKDLYDIVIVASILEREVPAQDMPLAAGIIYKRLNAGVALQVDASLVYILGRPLRVGDVNRLNSPYNTYKYPGLPPGPISNPGVVALEAALNPKASEYWYYLSRQDNGETIFSRTLEEHNTAVVKYLR